MAVREPSTLFQDILTGARGVNLQTLQQTLTLAIELAREGREGRKVGTMFVVSDAERVLEHTRCLILDPLWYHPKKHKRINDPNLRGTVKELAQLDGAFIVSDEGIVLAASRYIDVPSEGINLPLGLGSRHWAAAAITRQTRAVAIVVSESSIVRVFDEGALVAEIIPETWQLRRDSLYLPLPHLVRSEEQIVVVSTKITAELGGVGVFEDRRDAGNRLARALAKYRGQDVLVLAIPRGGVEVGYEVAAYLEADFSMVVCRKLPYPYNPEAGFGAVAEDGSAVILQDAARGLAASVIAEIIEQQKAEIQRRVSVLRGGEPLPEMGDRTVILVDDGIAMGSTMQAAIRLCRDRQAGRIVVAVPVAGRKIAEEMVELADEVVVLEKPAGFRAVAQVYKRWYDVPDSEVIEIMRKWAERRTGRQDRV
jgi:putative phosphoribosyl transferase